LSDAYQIVSDGMEAAIDSKDIPYGFKITIKPGYYEGIQLFVEEPDDYFQDTFDNWLRDKYNKDYDDLSEEEYTKYNDEYEEDMNKLFEADKAKVAQIMEDLGKEYGWLQLAVAYRFSNGETGYNIVDKKSSKEATIEKEAEGEQTYTFEELSPEAKEKVKYWLNEFSDPWWYNEVFPEEQKTVLAQKYSQYGITLDCLDIDWDRNNYCNVSLASGFKYWPAFKSTLVSCAKQVLQKLPRLKKDTERLDDWSNVAASDMYFVGDHFEFYAGLNDIDDEDGYVLSEEISYLCSNAYEETMKPILDEIASDFNDIIQKQEEYLWSDEYAKGTCRANEYEFDKDGNVI
jgi:hypothetical protein